MAFVYKGDSSNIIVSHGGTITQDRYGEQSATAVFKVKPGQWTVMPDTTGTYSTHPYADWLFFVKRRVVFTPGWWTVYADYKGVDDLPDPVYELNIGSGEEPIETHPNFESDIGGKPSAPLNGAVFVDSQGNETTDDAVGVFDRFRYVNPDANAASGVKSFSGLESYLDMNNITWTKTWTEKNTTQVDGGEVEIQVPEDGGAGFKPPVFKDRDWLYIGHSTTATLAIQGASVKHRKMWRLSGPGGWNPVIYQKVKAGNV